MKNIYLQLLDQTENSLSLATVTRTSGSTPQKPGSSAIFNENGLVAGTVGGGVVEGKVEALAKHSLLTRKSGYFKFNLANDISKKEEPICGGQIHVLIDANLNNYKDVFQQLKESFENRVPGVLITMVTRFAEDTVLVNRYWMTRTVKPDIPVEFMEKLEPIVLDMIAGGNVSDYRETELTIQDEEPSSMFFLEAVFPPLHLVIAGAGHIGRALTHLAHLLSFEVTVIDDRSEYANKENIPEADHIIVDDIGNTVKNLNKDSNTFVVIVTRGHKNDADALKPCIGSGLAYTGMIGSKNKIASMRTEFINSGLATADQWNLIYTPIGIDINSRTVEEIALSIAAQLVLVRNSER
jgi:xanthine dehydrogenase accessory factor